MTEEGQLTLADEAHARSTDPGTSHEAAASVTQLRPRQFAVLELLIERGPLTDEAIQFWYPGTSPHQSPSGLRTRRKELVDAGLVRDSGERSLTESGRKTIVWEVVPSNGFC